MQSTQVDAGFHTSRGIKEINEDCAGLFIPKDEYLSNIKGAAFCVADGVSSAEAGKEASEQPLNAFLVSTLKPPIHGLLVALANKYYRQSIYVFFAKAMHFHKKIKATYQP